MRSRPEYSTILRKISVFFARREHVNVGARKKRELRFIVLMLLLPVAQFLVFWLYVNFNSILMAFRLEQGGEYVYTFHNFNRFFVELKAAGGTMWTQIKNSLSFFPVSVCVTLPLSFVFSYFLYKKVPGTGFSGCCSICRPSCPPCR